MNQWFDPTKPLSEAESAPPVGQIYRRIWRFMREFRAGLSLAIGLSFLTSLAFALLPWPIRYLIDGVLLSDELDLGPLGTYASSTDGDKLRLALVLAGGVTSEGRGLENRIVFERQVVHADQVDRAGRTGDQHG